MSKFQQKGETLNLLHNTIPWRDQHTTDCKCIILNYFYAAVELIINFDKHCTYLRYIFSSSALANTTSQKFRQSLVPMIEDTE